MTGLFSVLVPLKPQALLGGRTAGCDQLLPGDRVQRAGVLTAPQRRAEYACSCIACACTPHVSSAPELIDHAVLLHVTQAVLRDSKVPLESLKQHQGLGRRACLPARWQTPLPPTAPQSCSPRPAPLPGARCRPGAVLTRPLAQARRGLAPLQGLSRRPWRWPRLLRPRRRMQSPAPAGQGAAAARTCTAAFFM